MELMVEWYKRIMPEILLSAGAIFETVSKHIICTFGSYSVRIIIEIKDPGCFTVFAVFYPFFSKSSAFVNKLQLRNITILVSSTLTVMAGAIIAPALPEISRNFSYLSNAEFLSKLILTLPALMTALLAPVAGYFTDRSGRKKVLLFSLVLYAIAGTTGAYLSNIYMILAGRALLGMAVGALMTSVVTLIGDYFEGGERSRFMGYQAAFAGIGGMLFISAGGILSDIHWRAPFLIYSISLIVFVFAWKFVSEPERYKTTQSDTIRGIGVLRDIPLKVIWVYLIAFFSMSVFYMIPVQMPFMLSALDGVSNTQVGLAIAFMNISSVTTALNYGRIKRSLNYAGVMALVYVLVAVGYIIISQSMSFWVIIAGILVAGAGFGMQMANLNLWLVSLAPPPMRGRLVGYLSAIIFMGMFLSPILLQPIIHITSLYQSFLIVGILLLVLSGIFCYGACLSPKKTSKQV